LRTWRVKLFSGYQSKWVENSESETAFTAFLKANELHYCLILLTHEEEP
jgi:hypothetical protein